LLLCPSSSIGDDLRYSGSPTRSPPSRARLIAVLRYIDPCLGLPCRARRPLPAKRRPKFISVAAWGARLRECSTPSIGFNLCENCYKFLSESNAAHRQSLQIGTATTDRDGKCHPPSVPIRAHPWFMSTRRYRLPPRPSVVHVNVKVSPATAPIRPHPRPSVVHVNAKVSPATARHPCPSAVHVNAAAETSVLTVCTQTTQPTYSGA